MLRIVGKPKDVEIYMTQRGVVNGFDPQSGQPAVYGGKKFLDTKMRKLNDGYETKYDMYRRFNASIKSVFDKQGFAPGKKEFDPTSKLYISGVANGNIEDRMYEKLNPFGLDDENYMKNPVLIADHRYSTEFALGLVEKLDKSKAGVNFEGFVGDPSRSPLTEKQRDSRYLIAQDIIKTVSVGFIPHKIIAPQYDDNDNLIEGPIIDEWELLELSIVVVPANPASIFVVSDKTQQLNVSASSWHNKDRDKSTANKTLNEFKKDDKRAAKLQTIIFDKVKFSLVEAKTWLKEHDLSSKKVDETESSYRFRQRDPKDFKDDSFKTIDIDEGIKAVIGKLKDESEDEKAMDEVKDLLKKLLEKNEAIADSLKKLSQKSDDDAGNSKDNEDTESRIKSLEDGLKEVKENMEVVAKAVKDLRDQD